MGMDWGAGSTNTQMPVGKLVRVASGVSNSLRGQKRQSSENFEGRHGKDSLGACSENCGVLDAICEARRASRLCLEERCLEEVEMVAMVANRL